MDKNTNLGELVRKAEEDFTSGETHVSEHVDFSLYDDINRIYAYLDSKHTSGATDSMGREKPFFNIVLAARNAWFRATDIDRSNIRIRATKSADDLIAFLATVKLQDWMRRENFGQFLNTWGLNSAAFNESVLKFVEKGGRLIPSVVPWNRIICDQVDFVNNPKIEVIELTEAQLRKRKEFDQELVERLCDAVSARETVGGEKKDAKNNYIKLYEVHGELPRSFLTGNEADEDDYVQQMHVMTFVETKDKGEYDDYTLFSGPEAKDPYYLAALLPETDGSISLKGSVKTQFDAQWMLNHTVKGIKDQLDLANKLVFQTSDPTFVSQNVLTAIENGDILIHKQNEPLTQLQNNSHDIESTQNFGAQWKSLGNELTGVSESMLGAAPKSGTAWRQTEAVLQESHDLFEVMTENRGLDIENVLRKYVLPFIKKDLNNKEEVSSVLTSHQLNKVDSMYINNKVNRAANDMIKKKLLAGDIPDELQLLQQKDATREQAQEALSSQGNQRFFKPSDIDTKTWKELFKNLEWDVEVDVTNENLDRDAMVTLNSLFVTLASNPGVLNDKNAKMVFDKILTLSGTVSPVEVAGAVQPPPPQAPQPGIPGQQGQQVEPPLPEQPTK